jgi:hypothetical protein
LAILVLELEDMVVRLFRPPKLDGVRGDRWTVRLGISVDVRVSRVAPGLARRDLPLSPKPPSGRWAALLRARTSDHNGLVYPSARHANGVCLAAFLPWLIQNFQQGESWILKWPDAQRRRS